MFKINEDVLLSSKHDSLFEDGKLIGSSHGYIRR